MTLRTAITQSWYVTAFVLLVGGWVVLKAGTILDVMGSVWTAPEGGPWVGQVATSGIVGLGVLAVFVGLLVVLYGELGQASPGPNTWPPEE